MEKPTALITGAARGIGAATAARFLQDGYRLALIDRVPITSGQAGEDGLDLMCDLGHADQIESTIDLVSKRFGALDVVVNNAGMTLPSSLGKTSVEDWDRIQSVNLRASFLILKHTEHLLAASRRRAVVNVASFHAMATIENFSAYAASKSGVMGLTRSIALEFAPKGIRVNAVCPGVVHTDMVDAWLETQADAQEALRSMVRTQPLGRLGRPEEIAAAIAFLASEQASYITGTSILVDGGVTARLHHA
ncbi:MAG: SDR family oxidoreductase [Rhizobiaceae bacterium]|nr:SDR family oxidoreductase [Rhizobiaceae bacterium]